MVPLRSKRNHLTVYKQSNNYIAVEQGVNVSYDHTLYVKAKEVIVYETLRQTKQATALYYR